MVVVGAGLGGEGVEAGGHGDWFAAFGDECDVHCGAARVLGWCACRVGYEALVSAGGVKEFPLSRGRAVGVPDFDAKAKFLDDVVCVLEPECGFWSEEGGKFLRVKW